MKTEWHAIDEANDAFLKFLNSLMNLSEAGDELDAFKKLWQNAASDIENGLMNTNAVKAFVSNWFSGDVQREIQSGAVDLAEIMNSGLTEVLMQGGKRAGRTAHCKYREHPFEMRCDKWRQFISEQYWTLRRLMRA